MSLELDLSLDTRRLVVKNRELLNTDDTEIPVVLTTTSESEVLMLDEGETVIFQIKARGDYTGDALAEVTSWTWGDESYTGTLSLDAAAINTAIGDEDTLKCMCQVKWTESGAKRRSEVVPIALINAVVQEEIITTSFTYLRSDGTSSIFRPDETSSYLRP